MKESLNFSEAKILCSAQVKTPFGDVLVHELACEPARANTVMPSFAGFPEMPEQYVAEFVSGDKKGLRIPQVAEKGSLCKSFEDALQEVLIEYARRISSDVYYDCCRTANFPLRNIK